MTKQYQLYCLLLILLFGGCKKADKAIAPNNTITSQTGDNNPPVVASGTPKLLKLRINGAYCGFDATSNCYYFPVSPGTTLSSYTVGYDSVAAAAVYINGIKLKSGDVLKYQLQTNQQLKIDAAGSDGATVSYILVVTGLPMVLITTPSINYVIDETKSDATMNLVDPDYQSHKVDLQTHSNITIAIRGATAQYLPKKSYKINTVDANGVARDIPLLGLRNDEDWILDAMYIDQARMRNRVCTDLWNSFNNVPYIAKEPTALNGTRGYMSEVFVNGQYAGLYCFTEKMDRKQLQVKKQYGMVYKSDEVTDETTFLDKTGYSNSSATWAGWELSYPDLGDTPAPDWKYLHDFAQFVATSADQDFSGNIASKVDINNLVEYFIFMNAIDATDNMGKNQYFSFYDYRTNGNFFYTPWDMDSTLGRDWKGMYLDNAILGVSSNYLFWRLIKLNAANFKDLVKTRWASLKNNQLSKVTVANRIEFYRNLLAGTLAFNREADRAGNISQTLNNETQYMNNWYSKQYDLVDDYVNNL